MPALVTSGPMSKVLTCLDRCGVGKGGDAAPGLARSLPEPRADLGLRQGYHSAQVPVEVRLNTNESPYPPPAEWLDALLVEARNIAFNRYPDRSALALRSELAKLHNVDVRSKYSWPTAPMKCCSRFASPTGAGGEKRRCSSPLMPFIRISRT